MSPFKKSLDMGFYRWGNGIILASMYVALLPKVDVSNEESVTRCRSLLVSSSERVSS